MLASVPRLNPAVRWEDLDSGQILVTYHKNARGIRKVLAKLFVLPEWSQVVLDGIGARVVRQMDARYTVEDLIEFVAGEFKLSRREARVALLKYLEMLGKRGLVGFEVGPAGENH